MKAPCFIFLLSIMALFLVISWNVQAQSDSQINRQDKNQKDELNGLIRHNLSDSSIRNEMNMGKNHLSHKSLFVTMSLSPDNMMAYIPKVKNPDNMPVLRLHYGTAGIIDPMPNLFKGKKPSAIVKSKIKSESHLSK